MGMESFAVWQDFPSSFHIYSHRLWSTNRLVSFSKPSDVFRFKKDSSTVAVCIQQKSYISNGVFQYSHTLPNKNSANIFAKNSP